MAVFSGGWTSVKIDVKYVKTCFSFIILPFKLEKKIFVALHDRTNLMSHVASLGM